MKIHRITVQASCEDRNTRPVFAILTFTQDVLNAQLFYVTCSRCGTSFTSHMPPESFGTVLDDTLIEYGAAQREHRAKIALDDDKTCGHRGPPESTSPCMLVPDHGPRDHKDDSGGEWPW